MKSLLLLVTAALTLTACGSDTPPKTYFAPGLGILTCGSASMRYCGVELSKCDDPRIKTVYCATNVVEINTGTSQ